MPHQMPRETILIAWFVRRISGRCFLRCMVGPCVGVHTACTIIVSMVLSEAVRMQRVGT
jgi:hypothetical protein